MKYVKLLSKISIVMSLMFLGCQKDYYLDDLNDALSQISSLESRNQILNSQLSQLQSEINNLNTKNSNLQNSYDDLNQLYQSGQFTIEDLNTKIIELADLLRTEQAINNNLSDGYYLASQFSRIINDTLSWESEFPTRVDFFLGEVVKVEDNSIVENYHIDLARNFWNNPDYYDILKRRTYPSRDYTYLKEFREKMYINQYTGDSLPYYSNYKVIDRDVFTNSLVEPKNFQGDRIITKYVYHKLFSDEYEIIEGIKYPPVVDIANSQWNIGQYSSFDEISNVYDYYSDTNFFSDPIYKEIDQSDPKSYLNAFIKDAERNGVDLSNINPDLLEVVQWYTPTDQYERNVIAWGSINCSLTNNRIGLSNGWFNTNHLTDDRFMKLKIMYHEFGHTVLGLKHTCAKNHIMTAGPSGYSPCNGDVIDEYEFIDNVDHFKRAVSDMFNGYNQFYHDCYQNTTFENIHVE